VLDDATLASLARACRDDMLAYFCFVDRNYRTNAFHTYLARRLAPILARGHGRVIISAPPQHGKLCSDDTHVLTANRGWTLHGALRVGDEVFGVDGRPTRVVGVAPAGEANCEVEFTDGSVVRCHEAHEWTVWDRSGKQWRTLETRDMERVQVVHGERGQRGSRARFQLPNRVPLSMPHADLPVDPYTLGAWLGDGSLGKPVITHAASDVAVVERIAEVYARSGQWAHPTTGVLTTSFAGGLNRAGALTISLRAAGVYERKHIPAAYLTASEAQRMELLAGLVDTDGFVFQRDQRVCISTCEPALASDIAALIRSLGWRATVSETQPAVSSSGIVGRRVVYQVSCTPDRPVPTRLDRKQIVGRPGCQRRIGVAAIRRIEPTRGRCIQVDRDDGLYLVGRELIPTHNSEFVSRKLPAYVLGRYPHWDVIAASYGDDLVQLNGAAVRDLVGSAEHAAVFPEATLRSDTTAKDYFATSSGRYLGTTVRGGATGFGARLFVIDDPFKDRVEADSITTQTAVWNWFKSVAYTRLAEDSVLIIMHTRWSENDLVGQALDKLKHEGWEVINLPALAEENDLMGRAPGEALVPERFSVQALHRIRQTMGGEDGRDWLALYQGKPRADGGGEFKEQWIQRYTNADAGRGMNKLIVVDPASGRRGKEADNDYTSTWVLGLAADHNFYVLDYVRDRLNLAERADLMFRLHRKWRPIHPVRYEHYGMQADIEHLRSEMERRQYRFKIVEVGGQVDKKNRIRRLIPLFSQGRIYLPNQIWYTNKAGETVDLINDFIEIEYKPFPVGRYYDSLDSLARIAEPNEKHDPNLVLTWPDGIDYNAPVVAPWVPTDAEAAY